MRLRERSKQAVTVKEPDNSANDNRTFRWKQEGAALFAAITPISSETKAKVYGMERGDMRLMLYDGAKKLETGMGVCVDVAPGESCDYRIVGVEKWDCVKCTLEYIEEGKRR